MKSFSVAFVILLTAIDLLMATGAPAIAKTIKFSGYDWKIRPSEERSGPGPNHWEEGNVSVDSRGYLHLKLTERRGRWYCAEIYTEKAMGFGLYQFQIIGRLDQLDPNVVFGLFNYPRPEVGPDGSNEIDIEFAKWGNASAAIGNYTVWPARTALGQSTRSFTMNLSAEGWTTHDFTWSDASVLFRSFAGNPVDRSQPLANWMYQPRDSNDRISHKPMPIHINLWCFEGHPPRNGQPVELIVSSFKFTPRQDEIPSAASSPKATPPSIPER